MPDAPAADAAKTPADFLKSIRGKPVVVKLNSGVDYRGILACLDGYMNIAMEQTEVRARTRTRARTRARVAGAGAPPFPSRARRERTAKPRTPPSRPARRSRTARARGEGAKRPRSPGAGTLNQ